MSIVRCVWFSQSAALYLQGELGRSCSPLQLLCHRPGRVSTAACISSPQAQPDRFTKSLAALGPLEKVSNTPANRHSEGRL